MTRILAFAALAATLLWQVSPPTHAAAAPLPFDHTLKVYLAYDKPQDRDEFIKRLQVIWRNTLNDYQPTPDFKVVFVKEKKNVGQLPETTSSQTRTLNEVTYRLTGATQLPFVLADVSAVFRQTVQDAHLAGVEFDLGGGGGGSQSSSDNASGTDESAGAAVSSAESSDASNQGAKAWISFDYTLKVFLAYDNAKDRNEFLKRLKVIWRNTLNGYLLDPKLKIVFVSEKKNVGKLPETSSSQTRNLNEVTYRLTGASQRAFNIDDVSAIFKQTVQDAHLAGVTFDQSWTANSDGAASGGLIPFDHTLKVFLAYDNSKDRDEFIKRLQVIWRNTLNDYLPSPDFKLVFIKEKKNVGQLPETTSSQTRTLNEVTYRLTGSTQRAFNIEDVSVIFQQTVQDAHLAGVTFDQSWNTGHSAGKAVSVQSDVSTAAEDSSQSELTQSLGTALTEGTGLIPFDHTLRVFLAYDNSKDRDEFIKRLQVIWRNTLNDYLPSPDFKLVFVKEKKNVGQLSAETSSQARTLNEVTYRLTGSTQRAFNIEDVSAIFQQTVKDAHLAGVTFDENWSVGSSSAKAAVSTVAEDNSQSELTQSSGTALPAGTDWIDFDHVLDLKYTSTSERDRLLQLLLPIWQGVLTEYGITELKIRFDRADSSSQSGYKTVSYRLSGKITRPVDISVVSDAFIKVLSSKSIAGISVSSFLSSSAVATQSDSSNVISSVSSSGKAGKSSSTQASVVESSAVSNIGEEVQAPLSVGTDWLDFNHVVDLKHTSSSERDRLLQSLLPIWRGILAEYGITDLKIVFDREDSSSQSGYKSVSYRLSGKVTRLVDADVASDAFIRVLSSKPIVGISVSSFKTSSVVKKNVNNNTVSSSNTENSESSESNSVNSQSSQTSSSSKQKWGAGTSGSSSQASSSNNAGSQTSETSDDNSVDSSSQQSSNSSASTTGDVSEQSALLQTPEVSLQAGSDWLDFVHVVNLKYTSASDRDRLLRSLLPIWQGILAEYGVTGLKVVFDREDSSSQSGYKTVSYRLSGKVTRPVDLSVVSDSFSRVLLLNPIGGISVNSSTAHNTFIVEKNVNNNVISSFSSSVGGGRGSVSTPTPIVESSVVSEFGDEVQAPLLVGNDWLDFNHVVGMKYATAAERDRLLRLLLPLWQGVLAQYGITDLKIVFDREDAPSQPGVGGYTTVSYRLSGKITRPADVGVVSDAFVRVLSSKPIAGISVYSFTSSNNAVVEKNVNNNVISSFSSSFGGGGSISTQASVVESSVASDFGDEVQAPLLVGNDWLDFNHVVDLKYTSASERDRLLQSLLPIWQGILAQYGIKDLKIVFDREDSSTQPGYKTVSYRLSGKVTRLVDTDVASAALIKVLSSKPIAGVSVNSFTSKNNVIVEKNVNNKVTSSFSSSIGGGGSISTQASVVESSVASDFGDEVQAPLLVGNDWLDFNHVVNLKYTSASDRDRLLQSLLPIWQGILAQYGIKDLKIVFDREDSSSQPGYKTVSYRLSGKVTRLVDTDVASDAFIRVLSSKPIAGVLVYRSISNNNVIVEKNVHNNVISSFSSSAVTGRPISTQATVVESSVISEFGEDAQPPLVEGTDWLDFNHVIYLKYTSPADRDRLLQQLLPLWQDILLQYGITELKIVFDREDSSPVAGYKAVSYRIKGKITRPFDLDAVTGLFIKAANAKAIPGVLSVVADSDANVKSVSWKDTVDTANEVPLVGRVYVVEQSASTKKPITVPYSPLPPSHDSDHGNGIVLRNSIMLSYGKSAELDQALAYMQQLYAYLLGFNVDSVVLTVVRDVPVEAGYTIDNAVIHNIDYSVSVTEPLTADLTAESIKSRFDALMKSSSQTYAMQFAKDRKPPVVSYTILDLVQGPQNRRSHDSYSKSFVVYGNIGLKYNSKRERNQILERIRHLWEDAAGRKASSVDLAVTQDILNLDGTHQVIYAVTILSPSKNWDISQLSQKFQQLLVNAKISSVVLPGANDAPPDVNPPEDNGVKSFGFYDTILLKFTSQKNLDDALEAIRKNWEKILGPDAWNVQIYVNSKKPTSDGKTIVSFAIMFSSLHEAPWNFDDMKSQFLPLVSGIKGSGFSAYQYNPQLVDVAVPEFVNIRTASTKRPVVSQSTTKRTTTTTSYVEPEAVPSGEQPVTGSYIPSPPSVTRPTYNGYSGGSGSVVINIGQAGKISGIKDKHLVVSSGQADHRVSPLNTYLITDQFRITGNDEQRIAFMNQVEGAWLKVIGNETEFVQLVLYNDVALSGANSQTHDLHYVVVILSSASDLDLNALRTSFERVKPKAAVKVVGSEKAVQPSSFSFLALRNTYPLVYAGEKEYRSSVDKLQQLWIEALGNQALTVEVIVFEDELLDTLLGSGSSVQKQLHHLSYLILLVSDHPLDAEAVEQTFQHFLLKKSLAGSACL